MLSSVFWFGSAPGSIGEASPRLDLTVTVPPSVLTYFPMNAFLMFAKSCSYVVASADRPTARAIWAMSRATYP